MSTEKTSSCRQLTGVVVSNKMTNAIVVRVERRVRHPVYRKYIRRSTKVHAQDIENTCNVGDVVTVQECPPISKTITWKLVEVKERAA